MKRILLALVIFALSLAPALAEEISTNVLVYVSGDDLELYDGSAQSDFGEMIYAGIPEEGNVNLLVMTGGCEEWWNGEIDADSVGIHEVTGEGMKTVESLPLSSMGSAETLGKFVAYGMEEAPADRYILVLWGHGDGPVGGVCSDPLFDGDVLMPDELSAALEGVRLDAVIFDACMMNSIEIAQALEGSADYMVASQESTVGSGLRYDRMLRLLLEQPQIGTRELCERVAQTYIDNNNFGIFGEFCTVSVLDLEKTGAVTQAAEELYGALISHLEENPDSVLERRGKLLSYGEYEEEAQPSDLVDAMLLADAFADLEAEACTALREAVSQMVVYNAVSDDMAGKANGLSLMMPYAMGEWMDYVYDWYGPQQGSSRYADLILQMAGFAEKRFRENLGWNVLGGIVDGLWQVSADRPSLSGIWDGLEE